MVETTINECLSALLECHPDLKIHLVVLPVELFEQLIRENEDSSRRPRKVPEDLQEVTYVFNKDDQSFPLQKSPDKKHGALAVKYSEGKGDSQYHLFKVR